MCILRIENVIWNYYNIIKVKRNDLKQNNPSGSGSPAESEDIMQVNLSEETIKTVIKALKNDKGGLQSMLIRVEIGKAAKEKKGFYEQCLSEVNDALQVFEEFIK